MRRPGPPTHQDRSRKAPCERGAALTGRSACSRDAARLKSHATIPYEARGRLRCMGTPIKPRPVRRPTMKLKIMPDVFGIQAGSLADPSRFVPAMDVFTEGAQPGTTCTPSGRVSRGDLQPKSDGRTAELACVFGVRACSDLIPVGRFKLAGGGGSRIDVDSSTVSSFRCGFLVRLSVRRSCPSS